MFMTLLAEHVDCKIDVGGGVGGADLYANASIALGITGGAGARNADALVEQLCGKILRQLSIVGQMAQLDGGDGVYVWRDGETGLGYALAELSGVGSQLVAQLGVLRERVEHGQCSTRDGRHWRVVVSE